MVFETIPCPACQSADYEPALEVTDRFRVFGDAKYSIVRCNSCGLLFLNPRPNEDSIGKFYAADEYDPFGTDDEKISLTSKLYRIARPFSIRRKAARVVHGLSADCQTLDVGCATGDFMLEMKRRGYQPFGVEPSDKAAEFARKKHGLTVWTGGIENVPGTAGRFDLITYWHVLEHVHRLQDNLVVARHLLSTTGTLAIAVPNPTSWDAKRYGVNWVAWDTPRHLYHFEPRVMMELLERHGFVAQRAGAVAFDAFYHCLLSEKMSLGGIVRGGFRGMNSYLRGLLGMGGSSELYIARKIK